MRVVLVGMGGWGKNHARVLSELGVLCAVCDEDGDKGREFGTRYLVNHYLSVEELFASEKFDAAIIATPTITHYTMATRFIKAKKHVFVEKPITCKSNEGEELADLAEKNGVVLTCGYIERFNPAVSLVKSYLSEKRYGDLIMLEFHRENKMSPHIKDVGIIHDTTVHDIDTANWLFDEMPVMVFARSGNIDSEHENFASIVLGYSGAKTAVISANWIAPNKVRTFRAVCTNAVIVADFLSQKVTVNGKDVSEISKGMTREPLHLELASFLDAANGDGNLVVMPRQAVNVTRIAEAALLSSKRGVPIYLELK